MYAVIKTGGKQYRVAANEQITIEKMDGNPGDRIEFTDVLMFANGDDVQIGAPNLAGATVVGEIAEQVKSPTVYIFKKRRRKHYRRRNGHRQLLTSVTITDILMGGAKPVAKAAAAKPVPAPKAAPAAKPVEAKPVEVKHAEISNKIEVKHPDVEARVSISRSDDTDGHVKISRSDDTDGHVQVAHSSETGSFQVGQHADASHGAVQTSTGYDFSSNSSDAKPVQDDLSLISGVGEKSAQIMRDMGYTTFLQVSLWAQSDIDKVEAAINNKGRVAREEWIEQARELRLGGTPRAKIDRDKLD